MLPDPQVVRGEAQVVPQLPPEQTVPDAQLWPQAPQLALSVWVFTSQPSAAVALQLAKPVAHALAPTVHAPAVQLWVTT